MAVAPKAIWDVWYLIEALYNGPGLQDEELAGIVGDRLHSFGFHLAPDELPSDDYSLQTKRDRKGAKANPTDASALDVHFGPSGMVTVTKRLIASAEDPNDHRLDCLYEFCGTTNGRAPHPYTVDTNTDDPNNTQGWDQSHVTHVHLSFHRDVCTNFDAIKGVASVIAGTQEDDMPTPADVVAALMAYKMKGQDGKLYTFEVFTQATNATSHDAKALADAANKRCAAIQAELDAIKAQLGTSGTGTPAPSTLNITGGTLTIGGVNK